jgi:hypothetical protein
LSVSDFDRPFLRARNAGVDAGAGGDLVLLDLLNDIWFGIDMHNEYDELREPDEFDDAQLREVLTRYLADGDAGPGSLTHGGRVEVCNLAPDPRWAHNAAT